MHEAITVKRHARGDGIFGSVVIQDKVTDLLDVAGHHPRGRPHVLRRSHCQPPKLPHPNPITDSKQFCTFFLNGLFFGVEVLKVQEVIRYQEMTRVPLAPRMIRGPDQSARPDRHRH